MKIMDIFRKFTTNNKEILNEEVEEESNCQEDNCYCEECSDCEEEVNCEDREEDNYFNEEDDYQESGEQEDNCEIEDDCNDDEGVYLNNQYYTYEEYENINYEEENDFGNWEDEYLDDYDDYYDDRYYSSKYHATSGKGNKSIKKIKTECEDDETQQNTTTKKYRVITDVSKITAKKLPTLTEEYKKDTKSLTENKKTSISKKDTLKTTNSYYAVRKGKKVGIYTSLNEAEKQVIGVSGSEWKKFKNIDDAKKYIDERKAYRGKCYVVIKGRKTGIYRNFELASEQVNGYSGGYMKKFASIEKAKEYINENNELTNLSFIDCIGEERILKIYTDGSYCDATEKYGSAFVIIEGDKEIYRFSYAERDITGKKNISGEIIAAIRALEWAFVTKYSYNIELNYDLSYIKEICMNKTKFKIEYGKILKEIYTMCINEGIDIKFNEIESHSGNYWNNLVDKLAKNAARVEYNDEMLFFKNPDKNKKYEDSNMDIAKNIIENRKKARNKKKIKRKCIKPICVSSESMARRNDFIEKEKNLDFNLNFLNVIKKIKKLSKKR